MGGKKSVQQKGKTNFLACILLGIFISVTVKTFILDIYRVKGFSMSGTVEDGQLIFVNKLAYGLVNPIGADLLIQWKKPAQNDVVIYLFQGSYVVKRCIAVENTSLDYLDDSEYILIVGNNQKIPLDSVQYHRMYKSSSVPEGYILAVGDNYSQSFDSRNYGFIPVNNILGKVICR